MEAASFATPDAEIPALRAQLAAGDAALRKADFEIEKLKVQLAALRRDCFSKSSEKLAAEIGS